MLTQCKEDKAKSGQKDRRGAGWVRFPSAYDEEWDEYFCTMELDEDEAFRYLGGGENRCPYFRAGDDYTLARRQ